MGRPRVSLVSYLNSVPLGWGFTHGPFQSRVELLLSTPAVCAEQLEQGEADVGLIPSVEYQRIPGLRVLPHISIASKKRCRSVLLVSRVPWEKISRVAVDVSSKTSVALLKLLFCHRTRIRPRFTGCLPQLERMLQLNEAALIIGDPALKISRGLPFVYDLAEEWYALTRKPFVFAFWAVRAGAHLGPAAALFQESKSLGLSQLDAIALEYSRLLGLSPDDVTDYLTKYLDYSLDAENLEGLSLFYRMALEQGLTPAARELEFYG
ncbi:MAG: menaquinone biosynthesis protein [Acidobacteria bacterium]|nr:menaquinone biosynthesis protein [Acidobacteriota bacterium]